VRNIGKAIRDYFKDQPVSKIMALLAVAFFVIAAVALGPESFGLVLHSLDMLLIGLSFLTGAIIFRSSFESSLEVGGPSSQTDLWPTIRSVKPDCIALGDGKARHTQLDIYGANFGEQDPDSMSELSQVWLGVWSLKYDEKGKPRIELWQSEHIRVRLPTNEEAEKVSLTRDCQTILVVQDPSGRATAPRAMRLNTALDGPSGSAPPSV
jgi:hypothetical protein